MTQPIKQAVSDVPMLFCVGFDGVSASEGVERFLRQGGGGYILFRRNIVDRGQLLELNRSLHGFASGLPPLAMIDQEGGAVLRLGDLATRVPPMRLVGQADDKRLSRRVGRLIGQEVEAFGFNVVCAPVLDVDTCAENPIIGDRAFSSDPLAVGKLGRAFIEGVCLAGVLPCGKHFPGHGDTTVDSHLDLPRLAHDQDRLARCQRLAGAAV